MNDPIDTTENEPQSPREVSRIERAITTLIGKPLEPGTLIKAEVFEELLGISRHTQAFSFLISHIRRGLYPHGLYLSGEGFSETGAYEICHPRDNNWIAQLAMARAERDLEGKLTLLMNTKLASLSDLEKKRHENTLRELSMKLNAMRRAHEVEEIFQKKRARKKTVEATTEPTLLSAEPGAEQEL